MRFIVTTLIVIFLGLSANAQSPIFEFECFSNANMTGDSCDICVGTSFQSRSFNGLMVYRLGVFNRWIDEPYLIRLRPGNSVEFIEQIGTNPDRITIPLNQTVFSTISGFIDSTFCAGANVDFSFFASDSLRTTAINYLDTIKIVGRGGTTVFFDTITQKYIITSPSASGGTNLSFTGASSPVTLNSSTGTDVNFVAGTSISLAATGTDLTITNTAPNINQTISTTGAAGNITLSDGGGTLNLNVNDADANPTNELQNLSLTGQTLGISSGTGVNLPVVDVAAGMGIGVASSAGVVTVTNTGDLSTTNEIQSLSYSAPNLSLSGGGGSVAIPQGTVTGTGAANKVAYWSGTSALTATTNFGFDGSNLAVGTTTITDRLNINGYTNSSSGYKTSFGTFLTDFGTHYSLLPTGSGSINRFDIGESGNFTTWWRSTGNIGFGVAAPSERIEIADGFIYSNGENTGIVVDAGGNKRMGFVKRSGFAPQMIYAADNFDISYSSTSSVLSGTATMAMRFKTNGNVGVGVDPSTKLDVAGNFKVLTRTGTATTIAGWGSDNISRDLALGTGLSITSGTLNASGTVGGTGTAGKVAYWNGTSALTATANFPFDGTSLAVGRSTAGAGRLNVTGNSTSVGLQVDAGALPDFGATVQMRSSNASQTIYGIDAEGNTGGSSNYINKFYNTGTGSSLLQLGATSGGTGDAVIQYNITGGGGVWSGGVDNSDSDKFKVQPFSALGGGAAGLTIQSVESGCLFGINKESPGASIDMDNTTDGIALSSGNTLSRPATGLRWLRYNSSMSGLETRTASSNWHVLNSSQSVLLGAGLALGSTPTITVNNGAEMAYTVTLLVGTAPTANAVIYTRTLANTWSVAPTVVFSAANKLTASEITKFYVDTQTTGSYTIRANGTLTAGETYKLNVIIRN